MLGDTYGLIVYQEQVMTIAQQLAGYSLGAADLLRRAMGKKKEILDKEVHPVPRRNEGQWLLDEAIAKLWETLVPFADYAFNRAHSAGYGLVSLLDRVLQSELPREYMAALLTSVKDDKDKSAIYLNECRRMGIRSCRRMSMNRTRTSPPRERTSDSGSQRSETLAETWSIRLSLLASPRAASPTSATSCERSTVPRATKTWVESLVKAGAFDSPGTRVGVGTDSRRSSRCHRRNQAC